MEQIPTSLTKSLFIVSDPYVTYFQTPFSETAINDHLLSHDLLMVNKSQHPEMCGPEYSFG